MQVFSLVLLSKRYIFFSLTLWPTDLFSHLDKNRLLLFFWLLETALQFPSETLLDEAHLLFVKGRCSGSMIWAFLPCIVSLKASCDLSRGNSRTSEYQHCHQQMTDAIMTLTIMINGAVYIFPVIQASQGHFDFWFFFSFSRTCNTFVETVTNHNLQEHLPWQYLPHAV